jgi:hypothetical protein
MSEWNNFNYVLKEIKQNAKSSYFNASKDLQNNKEIFLETIKYIYYQTKGQTAEYCITIPDILKYDEDICKSYSYYMYSMLNHLKYDPNDSKFNVIQTIKNKIGNLDNYYISMYYNHNSSEREIQVLKSLIFSQRKLKDKINELKEFLNKLDIKNNKFRDEFKTEIKNDYDKLKSENNELKLDLNKFKYEINDLKDEFKFNKLKLNIILLVLIIIIIILLVLY